MSNEKSSEAFKKFIQSIFDLKIAKRSPCPIDLSCICLILCAYFLASGVVGKNEKIKDILMLKFSLILMPVISFLSIFNLLQCV